MDETCRSPEELKMDKVVAMLRKMANDIGSLPRNNIIKREDYCLIADVDDLYNFLICVEDLYEYHKGLVRPTEVHPDQLSLFEM
jgi:hypothetical protein